MFFIWGIKSGGTKAVQTSTDCPYCTAGRSIIAACSHKYLHLFWIPIFPMGRNYVFVCNSCSAEFTQKKSTIPKDIKKSFKTPLWTWIGLAAVVLFFGSAILVAIVDSFRG